MKREPKRVKAVLPRLRPIEKRIVRRCADSDGKTIGWAIFCPACRCGHLFHTDNPHQNGSHWTFNGNEAAPTFQPSMLVRSGHHADGKRPCWCDYNREHPENLKRGGFECGICHSYVTDGRIQFLGDCTHKFAGQTLALEPF